MTIKRFWVTNLSWQVKGKPTNNKGLYFGENAY
jgi:hypothetical protein